MTGVRDQLLSAWRSQGPACSDIDAKVMASWMSRILAGQTTVADFKLTLTPTEEARDVSATDASQAGEASLSSHPLSNVCSPHPVAASEAAPQRDAEDLRGLIRRQVRELYSSFSADDDDRPSGGDDIEAAVAVITRMMTVPAAAVAAYMQLHVALDDPATRRMLNTCESRFGRPLHIHEFLRHRAALYDQPACAGQGGLEAVVAALHARHMDAFALVCRVHRRLLGETDFDEIRFVKEYVGRPHAHRGVLDEPAAFAARLEASVLDGPLYAEAVGARLRAIYATAIDDPLSDHVLRHLITKARGLRIGPTEPQDTEVMLRLVADVSLQTNRFRVRVVALYEAVLGRLPDEDEVLDGIGKDYEALDCAGATEEEQHRPRQSETHDSLAAAERRAGMRLASGLEFHDVLKRRIPATAPPAMYAWLEAVVMRLRAGSLDPGDANVGQGEMACALPSPFRLYFGWDMAVHKLVHDTEVAGK